MEKFNIFSGAFADEVGQRFLKAMTDCCVSSFQELHNATIPDNKKQFKESLDRVGTWDSRLLSNEILKIKIKYPDYEDCFKHIFTSYARSMKGGPRVRLTVQIPKIEDFLLKFFVSFSSSSCVQTANYFTSYSVLDKRVSCLDSIRDALFNYLTHDFVQAEHKSVISEHESTSKKFRGARRERDSDRESCVKSDRESCVKSEIKNEGREWDDATKVISNIGEEAEAETMSDLYSHPKMVSEEFRDAYEAVGPDDSVSNANFTTNQNIELKKLMESQDMAKSEPLDIVKEDVASDHSRTSLSLSSVSLSQDGFVPKKKSCLKNVSSKSSDISVESSSSVSQQGRSRHRRQDNNNYDDDSITKSTAISALKRHEGSSSFPVKSYITSLTEETDTMY